MASDLPGTGGAWKVTPEDFVVEEIPAYAPSGEGSHTFLWIEKRALSTDEAIRRLASALGVPASEAGAAGLKDRQALTRQWISLPGVDPSRALACSTDELRVLDARRHPHKLRTGHLRGNRFTITLRGVEPDGAVRARAILSRLAERGLPNFYGEQRFGRAADNADRGRALLQGKLRERDRRLRRLYVSALQSSLFNRVLQARIEAGHYGHALEGDVLEKVDTGGRFVCTDVTVDDARVQAWQVQPTGPLFGPHMMEPAPSSYAAGTEAAVLAESELTREDFARAAKLAPGSRRAFAVRIEAVEVEAVEGSALRLGFTLPSGAYATVLLGEVVG